MSFEELLKNTQDKDRLGRKVTLTRDFDRSWLVKVEGGAKIRFKGQLEATIEYLKRTN